MKVAKQEEKLEHFQQFINSWVKEKAMYVRSKTNEDVDKAHSNTHSSGMVFYTCSQGGKKKSRPQRYVKLLVNLAPSKAYLIFSTTAEDTVPEKGLQINKHRFYDYEFSR